MNNEIKKIILSVDVSDGNDITEDKIQGIVVVSENDIVRYGYGKMTQDELMKKYSELTDELLKIHESELTGLDKQQAINKLCVLKKIEISDKKVISRITTYEKSNKFIVEYADADTKTYNYDTTEKYDYNLKKVIKELVDFYGLYDAHDYEEYPVEYLNSLSEMGLYREVKPLSETLKLNQVKNFVLNHKVLSGVLAGAITLGLGYGVYKLSKSGSVSNPSNGNAVISTTTDDVSPTLQPKPVMFENEQYLFPFYVDVSSEDIIVNEINGISHYMNDGYDSSFAHLNEMRNQEMSSVANHVQNGSSLERSGNIIYYENKFANSDSAERYFVKYFSIIGNSIIRSAYQENNYESDYGVLRYSKLSAKEVIRLICDDEPLIIYINGEKEYVRYSQLSTEAKEAVLNIAWANNLPFYNQTLSYNGALYTQDDISEIIIDLYNNLNMVK